MDKAYVDAETNQATCVWHAPDRAAVEALFNKAGVQFESFKPVEEYGG